MGGGWGKAIGGWQVGGIFLVNTGEPITALTGFSRSRSQNRILADRPNLRAGASNNPVLGGPDRYFDPLAFTLQPAGFLGTAGRNILPGPGTANWDFSLMKEVPLGFLGEGRRLEFRAEMFNLLNRVNLYNHSRLGNTRGAAVYTGTETRGSTTPLPTAGVIDRTVTDSRQVQLALKLIF